MVKITVKVLHKNSLLLANDNLKRNVAHQVEVTIWLQTQFEYLKFKLASNEISLKYITDEKLKEIEDKYQILSVDPRFSKKSRLNRTKINKRERGQLQR